MQYGAHVTNRAYHLATRCTITPCFPGCFCVVVASVIAIEPSNETAQQFLPVILEKLALGMTHAYNVVCIVSTMRDLNFLLA